MSLLFRFRFTKFHFGHWLFRWCVLASLCKAWGASQTITWTSPTNDAVLALNRPYSLAATASSGLPVSFRVVTGPASITHGQVTVTHEGTTVLLAEQTGDATHSPASATLTVNPSSLQISRLSNYETGANVYDVQVVGNLAYVADGISGLRILDLTNPAVPVQLSRFPTGSYAQRVQVVGHLAYVAAYTAGLVIVDVSDPANPTWVGSQTSALFTQNVEVVGTLAYLAVGTAGIQIVDVSDPTGPVLVGSHDTSGSAVNLTVVDGIAYVALSNSGLEIIDVRDASRPETLSTYQPSIGLGAVSARVFGHLVYLGTSFGLQIVDVSNPRVPVAIGGFPSTPFTFVADVVGNLAFLADGLSGLLVLDVSNPTTPRLAGSYDTDGVATRAEVVGDLAFVADREKGLLMLRLREGVEQRLTWISPTNGPALVPHQSYPLLATSSSGLPVSFRVAAGPAFISQKTITVTNAGAIVLVAEAPGEAPYLPVREVRKLNPSSIEFSLLGRFDTDGTAEDVQVVGNLAYVAAGTAGLNILDVSDRTKPALIGAYDTEGKSFAVQVLGNLAYVSDGPAGLRILDVSDPTNPVSVGGFGARTTVLNAHVVNQIAYVADSGAGLVILDVADPANPVLLSSFRTFNYARELQVVGPLAYVATELGGLQIVDVSNPAAPVTLATFGDINNLRDVHVVGNLAYVSHPQGRTAVIDVTNPTDPFLIGTPNWWSAHDLQTTGGLTYLAAGSSGLVMLDATQPEALAKIGTYDTAGTASGLDVVGDHVFLADGDAGLQIIQIRARINQSLTWLSPSLDTPLYQGRAYPLIASTTSGLRPTFQVLEGPAVIDQDMITFTGSDRIILAVEQPGDEWFYPTPTFQVQFYAGVFNGPQLLTPNLLNGDLLILSWVGGSPPFTILKRDSPGATPVQLGVTNERTFTVSIDAAGSYYQVVNP